VNTTEVTTLVAYNQWANRRLLAAACLLPGHAFEQDQGASAGSLKGTLVHILAGEWNWLRFWQGKPSTALPTPHDFPDAAAVAATFQPLEREQSAYASQLTEQDLRAHHRIRGAEYTLADLLHHAFNHSTYHRGQVALLLRQLGVAPPATDFRLFLDETGGQGSPGAA
jgi:uncharacterized damage-inducible protein DinB